MARDSKKLDGGVPVGAPQDYTTGGNVITPVEGLSVDAGIGKPPRGGPYGAIGDGEFPTAGKMPGGNSKAINSFLGSGNPGGGKR